ncbi:ArsR/SmtB family transcription factor [Clostridium aciditolerans]|uniref:Winged helix-turn-helix transcriptional regulator n=1 Tax=Clostridium aciditolerans TaxID=339861 RepID=A0A934HT25_9CLOT|nr:metalloregulator ArsR/SmtB family transcription factor [Clostridium aciditolerans]MBI6873996.1 winged helix-turn-helix transcriptional regulator [Clostridium aciditolerans]
MDNNFERFNETAEFLKVLAHPVRLCIVRGLLEKGRCNVSHMQNCLDMPQSTISQHLQKLRTAGIIEGERNGLEINYRVCDERVKRLIETLFDKEDQ